MPYPSKRSNDLNRAASALRKALKCAAALLDDPEPGTRLKAVHATATAAGTLAKLVEISDLERRLADLEEHAKLSAATRLRKVHL